MPPFMYVLAFIAVVAVSLFVFAEYLSRKRRKTHGLSDGDIIVISSFAHPHPPSIKQVRRYKVKSSDTNTMILDEVSHE